LIRASAVVNRQSTVVPAAFRVTFQAATSRWSVARSAEPPIQTLSLEVDGRRRHAGQAGDGLSAHSPLT
jgi:hypothetical protein